MRPKAGWYNQPINYSAKGGETHWPYTEERRRRRKRKRRRSGGPSSLPLVYALHITTLSYNKVF
jgi:hypothetical protein